MPALPKSTASTAIGPSEPVKAVNKLYAAGACAVIAFAPVVACSSSSSTTPSPPDSGSGDDDSGNPGLPDPSNSICGHPGDQGNSVGVGKFCQSSADCSDNTKATLCAIIGDDRSFFCTFVCHQDGPPDQCGEDAECACQGPCGCFPKKCDDRPADDGGTDAPTDSPQDG